MRQFRRPAVEVPTLRSDGSGGKKRKAHIDAYDQTKLAPSSFPSHWTSADVRGALFAMQGRVCAYCGADIEEAGMDVEHFRPKGGVEGDKDHGGYWWLAYEFSNYVLSCTVCNQQRKSNRFPMWKGASRVQYPNRATLDDEQRTLLDPTLDNVETWLSFDWLTPAGRIIPNPALAPDLAQRVGDVLDFFRINYKAARRRKRLELQKLVLEKVEQNKAIEVRGLAIRYRPHSIVARQILEAKAPEALPSPEQELEWLLGVLTSDLLDKFEDLEDSGGNPELDETEAKELLWALAVLWKDPPAADSAFVEAFLARRDLRDQVAKFLAVLEGNGG